MLTLVQIRNDLKEIKYYYSHQKTFDRALQRIANNSIIEKVNRYSAALSNAPARLYDLFFSLYVDNNTQQSVADLWCYSVDYIKRLNKKLYCICNRCFSGLVVGINCD